MADFGFGFVRVLFGLGVGFGLVWFGAPENVGLISNIDLWPVSDNIIVNYFWFFST